MTLVGDGMEGSIISAIEELGSFLDPSRNELGSPPMLDRRRVLPMLGLDGSRDMLTSNIRKT